MNIIILTSHYTRAAVAQDINYLYLFTDNQERTSRPDAPTENIDPKSWYYQKYKPTTTKPLHFGSLNNPTSAVIRGLNNAYPISTLAGYGRNWTTTQLPLFQAVIAEEIAQIQRASKNYHGIKMGNFRLGQGGRWAKLPPLLQEYLDQQLQTLGLDNTGKFPRVMT